MRSLADATPWHRRVTTLADDFVRGGMRAVATSTAAKAPPPPAANTENARCVRRQLLNCAWRPERAAAAISPWGGAARGGLNPATMCWGKATVPPQHRRYGIGPAQSHCSAMLGESRGEQPMQHQCPEACVGIVGGSADDLSEEISTVLRHKGLQHGATCSKSRSTTSTSPRGLQRSA